MDNPIQALVLKKGKYRESSLILKVITEKHGLISVLLKGVLRKKSWVPDVGSLIHITVKRRGESGLYILVSMDFEHSFSFSNSLFHIALRDCSFELILSIVKEEEIVASIYELLGNYLHHLGEANSNRGLFLLWVFIIRLGEALGVRFERRACVHCGRSLECGGELVPEFGGFVCIDCRPNKSGLWSYNILSMLINQNPSPEIVIPSLASQEKRGITHLLVGALRSHFDIYWEIKSLTFLDELL